MEKGGRGSLAKSRHDTYLRCTGRDKRQLCCLFAIEDKVADAHWLRATCHWGYKFALCKRLRKTVISLTVCASPLACAA